MSLNGPLSSYTVAYERKPRMLLYFPHSCNKGRVAVIANIIRYARKWLITLLPFSVLKRVAVNRFGFKIDM